LESKRKLAVSELRLKRGDLVVDVGCGTGLNFPHLQEVIGVQGKIVGVDFSEAMLNQARLRIDESKWLNVELVQVDAAKYQFPAANGIISTLAFTFIPHAADIIRNGALALEAGRSWVVMDMAWPDGLPIWFRNLIPSLSAYGITNEIIEQRPWLEVWNAMNLNLIDVQRRFFWAGFFFIAKGQSAKS
jgi:demethylmenaquinone methyltransferase/2-methoxy-6-polyprenyl-1,4-benzoquinol methylase